jgi:hypothetical protein
LGGHQLHPDASADFEAMPNPDRSLWDGSKPIAQNSDVAIPEISQ